MGSYLDGGAILRADLTGVSEQAVGAERNYIATLAATPFPVDTTNGQYLRLNVNKGNLLRDEVKEQAAGEARATINRAFEPDTYDTIRWELNAKIPDETRAKMRRWQFELESNETRLLTRAHLIRHERAAAAIFQNTGTFSVTSAGTAYTVANLATFDIGLDVDTAKAAIASRGESLENLALIIPQDVFFRARASTKLQNRIRGNMASDTILDFGAQAMADALGVAQVLVAGGYYDNSQQGSSASSLSSIWANSHLWLGKVGEGDYFSGGAVRTLHCTEDLPSLFTIRSFRDDDRFSDVINSATDNVIKVINSNAAQLIATSYA